MPSPTGKLNGLGLLCTALLLAGCGGGGGGGGGGGSSPLSGAGSGGGGGSGWVSGVFQAESTYAAQCVTPRTGIDPATQKAYPDRQGSLLTEQNWLRSWTHDLYLWYGEVTDQDPSLFATDAAYFKVLKTNATTASGNPKDKFHFTYTTAQWEALAQSGVQAGYGADFEILAATPPRNVVVGYTEPNSPASSAPVNLLRGTKLLTIDGVDVVNASDQASVDKLNAGLSPATVGESHSFAVQDPGATSARSVTMISANVASQPVQNVKTIATATGPVGYLTFNDHLATSESALVDAFNTLKAAGVKDLILDIRYNGGGYLDIASEVAYMIAGPTPTAGQTFELTQFNDKHPTTDPVTGAMITPLGFHTTTQNFSLPPGQALPTLSLTQVFVLTGPGTCSASESIINSLRGVNVQVVQVGSTTCGKPYGFYPQDNCGVTYFSIEFQGVNAQNFGNYPDGFSPANTTSGAGFRIPGCSVADDFAHALGDPAEARLAAALGYRATGVCPTPPTGLAVKQSLSREGYLPPSADGLGVKSIWQRNRIFRQIPDR